jgi:hypothetical protein
MITLDYLKELAAKQGIKIRSEKAFIKQISWIALSRLIEKLPFEFIEKYSNYFDWRSISWDLNLNSPIFDKLADKIYWNIVPRAGLRTLSEGFISKHADKFDKMSWYYFCKYQQLSAGFMQQFSDKINWAICSETQELPRWLIDLYSDKVEWNNISQFQILSEPLIEKYADKINWKYISRYQVLSDDFISKYEDKVDWDNISQYQKMSPLFVQNFAHKLIWRSLNLNKNITLDTAMAANLTNAK